MAGQPVPLSPDEINSLRDAFSLFDKDGDGTITINELGEVMKSLGLNPTADELRRMMREVDTDRSGTIDFSEFVTMMAAHAAGSDEVAELRAAFDMFDKDGSGQISIQELRQVMYSLGERLSDGELREMIREADSDGDGEIDFNEFCKMMNS